MSGQLENQKLLALDRGIKLGERFVTAFESLVCAHEKTAAAVAKLASEDRVHRVEKPETPPVNPHVLTISNAQTKIYGLGAVIIPLNDEIKGALAGILADCGVAPNNNTDGVRKTEYSIECFGVGGVYGVLIANHGKVWRISGDSAYLM